MFGRGPDHMARGFCRNKAVRSRESQLPTQRALGNSTNISIVFQPLFFYRVQGSLALQTVRIALSRLLTNQH